MSPSSSSCVRLRRAGLLLLCCGFFLWPTSPARAELDESVWRAVRREAQKLMKTPGELAWKDKVIGRLAQDDTARAAALLVKWGQGSLQLEHKTLAPALAEAEQKFQKLVKLLRKAYDKLPPTQQKHRQSYDTLKKARDDAQAAFEIERRTQAGLAHAFAAITDPAAIDYLLQKGDGKLAKRKGASGMRLGILRAWLQQPQEKVLAPVLDVVRARTRPEARILVLNWIATRKIGSAFEAVASCLKGPETVVRRSALFTLERLDDPRAVKPLIDALATADGLFAEELERTLHYFTGRSFESSHKVWSLWWKREGEAWLRAEADQRHEKPTARVNKGGTTSFYGVETKSKRIVFVLDRSGSMKSPASAESRKPKVPRGPVTGPGVGRGGKDPDPEIRGDTKMEIARNQLAWSIRSLPKAVHFNVLFFSDRVERWKPAPELLPATPRVRTQAIDWFEKIEPQGATRTFDALLAALDYATAEGGADTIFLLSDGSPTVVGGSVALSGEALEAEYGAFLERNKLYKCVVHTIGVGPQHNRTLMQRIARDTGGTYRGIGNK